MTLRESAALASIGINHRQLLRRIVHVLLDRDVADDADLPTREHGESVLTWATRCRLPRATDADRERLLIETLDMADRQLSDANTQGIDAIPLDDERYPPLLRAIPDPPLVLWIRGAVGHLTRPAIALVGSRSASPHGLEMARILAHDLARAGLVVVSGLARGVDSAAHSAALSAAGTTAGVLGGGLDRIYPREHHELARAMQQSGVVISEFPPGVPPLAHHFPLRNRIISGLSHAVVVIEAPEKSGSLITASAAVEQGREVFVVPGHVIGARNRGGHRLIRDGAKLVESADDILEEVGRPVHTQKQPDLLSGVQGLPDAHDFTVDEVANHTGEPPGVVLARLLELELSGRIQRIGGGRFVRSAGRVLP
jgi:DNA processing protein